MRPLVSRAGTKKGVFTESSFGLTPIEFEFKAVGVRDSGLLQPVLLTFTLLTTIFLALLHLFLRSDHSN